MAMLYTSVSLDEIMPIVLTQHKLPCTVELVVRGYCDLSKPTSTGQTDACEGPSEDRVVRLPLLKLTDGSSIVKAIEMRPQQSTSPLYSKGCKVRIAEGTQYKDGFLLLYPGTFSIIQAPPPVVKEFHVECGAPCFVPFPASVSSSNSISKYMH
jgi:hypothetical protein